MHEARVLLLCSGHGSGVPHEVPQDSDVAVATK